MARYARNERLGDALQQVAVSSMRGSAGAKAYDKSLRGRTLGTTAPPASSPTGGSASAMAAKAGQFCR